MSTSITILTVADHRVRVDGDLVNLNDLYALAGSPPNQDPSQWRRLPESAKLIDQLAGNLHVPKSHIYKASKARVDRGGGTWAHKLLAVEYAGYLSPDLKLKVNETFLRVQAGDLTLAEEIVDRAPLPETAEDRRATVRMQGKLARNLLTSTLKEHGVIGIGFARCTNATYQPLLGGTAKDIKEQRGLVAADSLRDQLSPLELAAVFFAEAKADATIQNENRQGNSACESACQESARKVKSIL
jgi:hypothetical protein